MGSLKRQCFKWALVSGLLSGLAACSLAPQRPVTAPPTDIADADIGRAGTTRPIRPQPAKPPKVIPPLASMQPEMPKQAAGELDSAARNALTDDTPRPALLAGEPARAFERGGASWYGPGFQGRRTASGERFDMNEFTAAHRTLPFGTWVRVHSLVNGQDVDVRITDRGPFVSGRVIDLSRAAAEVLGLLGLGFKEVELLVPESTPVTQAVALPRVKAVKRRPSRRRPIEAN